MEILYSKYTDYRNKQFQIYTKIIKEDGVKKVIKEAVYPEGMSHVRHIADMYQLLKQQEDESVRYCPCVMEDGRIVFEFIEGETLKTRIGNAVKRRDKEEVICLVRYYCQLLQSDRNQLEPFVMTDGFVDWFGNIEGLENEYSKPVSNVDCNVGNVIQKGDKEYIIDYEWVFPFPIPLSFILYVNLSWLYYFDVPNIHAMLSFSELLRLGRVDESKIPVYQLMEQRHGDRIDIDSETNINLFSLKDTNLKQPLVDLNQIEMTLLFQRETDMIQKEVTRRLDAMTKNTKLQIDVPEHTNTVRIMIKGGNACAVKWFYVYGDGKELVYQIKNGYQDGAYVFFDAVIPIIEIPLNERIRVLEITGHYYFAADDDLIDVYHRNAQLRIEYNQLRIECNQLLSVKEGVERELQQIKESKSWQIIQKFNSIIDKLKGV